MQKIVRNEAMLNKMGINFPIFCVKNKLYFIDIDFLPNDDPDKIKFEIDKLTPLLCFDEMLGENFENNVYIWIIALIDLNDQNGLQKKLFYKRVLGKQEIQTKHNSVIRDIFIDYKNTNEFTLLYAGEFKVVEKENKKEIQYNFLSGSYMVDVVDPNNTPEDVKNDVENVFLNATSNMAEIKYIPGTKTFIDFNPSQETIEMLKNIGVLYCKNTCPPDTDKYTALLSSKIQQIFNRSGTAELRLRKIKSKYDSLRRIEPKNEEKNKQYTEKENNEISIFKEELKNNTVETELLKNGFEKCEQFDLPKGQISYGGIKKNKKKNKKSKKKNKKNKKSKKKTIKK